MVTQLPAIALVPTHATLILDEIADTQIRSERLA
jgi:hypothetical protein